jgi:hypothetical protein
MPATQSTTNLNERFKDTDVGRATFNIGAEASNAIIVSIQLYSKDGREMRKRSALDAYLSADANGDTFEPHSATLTVASGTDGITIPMSAANTGGHCFLTLISEEDGDIDVSITQTSGADTFYLVLIMPNGDLVVSSAITFA